MHSRIEPSMRMALVFIVAWALTSIRAQTVSEQTHFSAEDSRVSRPINLPEGVLAMISKEEVVRDTLEDEGKSQLPRDWLSAAEVHLAGPNEKDFVVMAVGLLRGANITTFWVFRPTSGGGYEMLLDAPAHDLIIKESRSKGYRDIELLSATAVSVTTVNVRFDAKKYQIQKRTSAPIN